MDFDAARQLANRTGFGATPAGINRFLRRGIELSIKFLLDDLRTDSRTLPLDWLEMAVPVARPSRRVQQDMKARATELQAWALREMVETTSPLTERLVLFWHGHFPAPLSKVPFAPLLGRQNALFRKHAGGDFKALLLGITADPAYILAHSPDVFSRPGPGPGFAKALLDATLGPGQYQQADVDAAVLAFTGWGVDPRTGQYRYSADKHDDSEKAFLGRSGKLNGTDIVNLLLEDARTADTITEALWRHFNAPTPIGAELTRLSDIWRTEQYNTRELLAAMMATGRFLDKKSQGQQVKSPLALMIGTLRTLYLDGGDWSHQVEWIRAMGQAPFEMPPGGWPSGIDWLSPKATVLRQQWLRAALREQGGKQRPPTVDAVALGSWLGKPRLDKARTLTETRRALLSVPPLSDPPQGTTAHEMLLHYTLDPGYQMM